jgi:hypothetical protein
MHLLNLRQRRQKLDGFVADAKRLAQRCPCATHSPSGGAVFARQPCDPIPPVRDVGQWLCVPPFRVVCLYQACTRAVDDAYFTSTQQRWCRSSDAAARARGTPASALDDGATPCRILPSCTIAPGIEQAACQHASNGSDLLGAGVHKQSSSRHGYKRVRNAPATGQKMLGSARFGKRRTSHGSGLRWMLRCARTLRFTWATGVVRVENSSGRRSQRSINSRPRSTQICIYMRFTKA